MGCGQSKTEQKVTKETRTAVSQSPQRADTTVTQVEKTATTTTTTTTATNNTTGENADKKNAVGDVIMVGKLKNKNATNTDTKDKETKETTTTEKDTGDDGKEVKEVHEKTKEVKTAAPAATTTTTTTTAAKRAADKKKNACADEVIDKIKLSSPTVKKREEREAAAFAERMLEENGYVNDEQPIVTYVDPMNEEQPIINEPCEVYITSENNMTITSSSNNNISQNAHPAEPSCNTSSSAQNSTSISPPPQPHENATPYKEPLVQTKVIATRVYEIDNGKSPEPIPQQGAPQQSNVHQDNKAANEHGEHHSSTHPDHLHHSAPHHNSPETKEHNGSHRLSTPRRGSGSMPDGARGASKTTGTHPTPKDKSSTARSLAKLHTTATSRLAQQYADQQQQQQQQQQQRRRSSSASQPRDEKQKTPEAKHEKTKPATKVATTTNTPPQAMAGDSEHPHPHNDHHHRRSNNDKENNEVHHKSTHSASPENKPTKETCVVKTNEMNGTINQSGKPANVLEVTKLQQQQQEKEEEKITMPEVVKDEQANDEANASENAEGQSSGPETSTLRQLYNRIASFTRILPTTPSRSQSQAQADSDAAKQQVESVEQKKEEVVECQTEQPHPSHEPAVEHENEQKHQHHHRKHDEQEKLKQQEQKQKQKEEEEQKKKQKDEEEEKKEEVQEDDDQQPEPEQLPSHYWRHSQSISGPTSYAADNAPTLVKTANGTSKHNAASKEPMPIAATAAATAVTTNTMHNKPLSETVEREKLRHLRRTRKTAAQKYNVLYNLENDAASTITAQSYRPKYNHLVRAQAMNSKGSMASQRSAEIKESTFEKKLRQREAEAHAEAGEQARAFSPEAAVQPEEKPAGPMWVTVIPQDDAAVNMSGGWGLLRQIRTLIQLSHTAAV